MEAAHRADCTATDLDVLVPFLARLLCPGAMVVTTRRGVDENPRHQMLRKMANRYVDSVVCVSASVARFTEATERIPSLTN